MDELAQTKTELERVRAQLLVEIVARAEAEAIINQLARRTQVTLNDGAVVLLDQAESDDTRRVMHLVRGRRRQGETHMGAALRLLQARP